MDTGGRTIPETMLVEILARLPLRIIARFKSVCKTWKSVIESWYFRRLFVSLHKNSSSSWSLMFSTTEAIGLYGCETWYLPKSLGSYIFPFKPYPNLPKNMPYIYKSFVGSPVLHQWVEIPPPPDVCTATGLVTRVNENGVVSSFQVIRTCGSRDMETYEWRVYVYSSETGLWTFKRLISSHNVNYNGSYPPVNLDGMLYLREKGSYPTEPGVLIAHDFYGPEDDDQCRVIPLPLMCNQHVRRCLTTSGGDVIYIEILYSKLKVWKLNYNNSEGSEWWRLSREEIDMAYVDCFPLVMNPVDSDIVYLWSEQHECLVSGNLRTRELIVHKESEDWSSNEGCWRINKSDSKGFVEDSRNVTTVIMLSRFVLPRWMDSVPRPPN